MRRKLLVAVGLCSALWLGAVAVLAQGPKPQGVQTTLGTGFSYQGQLKKNNTPVNDPSCSLTFSLWDSAGSGSPPSGGTRLGSDQVINSVSVSNGLFTVVLNGAGQFGASAFNGQDRWLQVAVQCTGDSSPATLSRQPLTAAPYALFSAAPWLTIGSTLYYTNGNVGIGTTSPLAKLDVETSSGIVGVYGVSTNYYGVIGSSTGFPGVYGQSTNSEGVSGLSANSVGVFGDGSIGGVHGETYGGYGVQGISTNGYGVRGISSNSQGVYGTSTNSAGVYGASTTSAGVYGTSSAVGVYGISTNAIAGYFTSTNNYGVVGTSVNSDAGHFVGNVSVTGSVSKGGGSFKIDHPLDPTNQYLYHSFVESPDMMDIYNGNVTTDEQGEATVVLPDWFEALNRDFRYQLTPIGQFALVMVASEIEANRFAIKSDKPHVKVSWQVTGIRHDPYANAHRIPVEEAKPPQERGKYLYPKEYGQPESLGIDDAMHQRMQQAVAGR